MKNNILTFGVLIALSLIFVSPLLVQAQNQTSGAGESNLTKLNKQLEADKKDVQAKKKEYDEWQHACSGQSRPGNCKEKLEQTKKEYDEAVEKHANTAKQFFNEKQKKLAEEKFNIAKISIIPEKQAKAGTGKDTQGVEGFVVSVIEFLIMAVGAIAVLGICVGGVMFMTSAGNDSMVQNAKQTLLYSALGLIFVLLSYAIVATVQSITYGLVG